MLLLWCHNYLRLYCYIVQVTTTSLRIKEMAGSTMGIKEMAGSPVGVKERASSPAGVLYEFPLFRVSYCGTDKMHTEAFSVVAKDNDGMWVRGKDSASS